MTTIITGSASDPLPQPAPQSEPTLPFVSIVIPVYNHHAALAKCLRALEEQQYPKDRYEVVVADNGSKESFEPLLRNRGGARVVCENRPGSYAARNKGVSLARGEIIAFTDADCLPTPNWLERGVAALLAHPGCGLVGGGIEVFHAGPRPNWVELWDCTRGLRQKRYVNLGKYAATANAFTFKRIFDEVGPFDASLKSSGDLEWGRRVGAAGYAVIYAEDACIRHPARATFRQVFRKTRRLTGGKYELRKRLGPPRANPWYLDLLGELRDILFHDARLKTARERLQVASVVVFIEFVRQCEKLRLRAGGTPHR